MFHDGKRYIIVAWSPHNTHAMNSEMVSLVGMDMVPVSSELVK